MAGGSLLLRTAQSLQGPLHERDPMPNLRSDLYFTQSSCPAKTHMAAHSAGGLSVKSRKPTARILIAYVVVLLISFTFILDRHLIKSVAGQSLVCLISITREAGGGDGLAFWQSFEEEATFAFAPSSPITPAGLEDFLEYQEDILKDDTAGAVIDPETAIIWPGNRLGLSRWALESSIPGLGSWSRGGLDQTWFQSGRGFLGWAVYSLSGARLDDPRSLLGLSFPVLDIFSSGLARGGARMPRLPQDSNAPESLPQNQGEEGGYGEGLFSQPPSFFLWPKESKDTDASSITSNNTHLGGFATESSANMGDSREPIGEGSPQILVGIYHTHSRESFLPEFSPRPSSFDDAHTSDQSKNVVRVGEEIASVLEGKYGIGVIHSKTPCDAEGKLGAYVESLKVAEEMLKQHPTIRILLDVHRDALPRTATTMKIGGLEYARLMLVLGTDRRLPHPNWRQNFEFALRFVRDMETKYPGVLIGIYPKYDRYNQHLLPGAMLLEIGGVENTLEECLRTSRLVAEVISGMIGKK